MLHVLKLDCNIHFINKITKNPNSINNLFPNICEFQVINFGNKIYIIKKVIGLLLLRKEELEWQYHKKAYVISLYSINNECYDVVLLLRSFKFHAYKNNFFLSYQNKIMDLIYVKFISYLNTLVNPFPSQSYKPTYHFSLIHGDVRMVSKDNYFIGSRWFITFKSHVMVHYER